MDTANTSKKSNNNGDPNYTALAKKASSFCKSTEVSNRDVLIVKQMLVNFNFSIQ